EMEGLGRLVVYRTTETVATSQGNGRAKRTDLLFNTLIPLRRGLSRPYDTNTVVYRITLKGDDNPAKAFAEDERQTITKVQGQTIELRVRAVREPNAANNTGKVNEEFLKSCYYLNSDDAQVKRLARDAVGQETDPWRK